MTKRRLIEHAMCVLDTCNPFKRRRFSVSSNSLASKDSTTSCLSIATQTDNMITKFDKRNQEDHIPDCHTLSLTIK